VSRCRWWPARFRAAASRIGGPCGLGLCVVLVGCGTSGVPRSDTVASLEDKPPPQVEAKPLTASPREAAERYRQFLRSAPGDSLKRAEATRRLADLQLEAEEGSGEAAEASPQTVDQVIRLYRGLLRDYPDYPRNDRVLYQLARAYEYAGRRDEALAALDRYAARYPRGERYAEVQFRRAEMLFVAKQYEPAAAAYAAVLDLGPDSGFYAHALYKRGWSLYKLNRYRDALEPFMSLVALETRNGSVSAAQVEGARGERLADTLRATALSFSVLGGPERVRRYFRETGSRPFEDQVYRRLGELYVQEQRWSDAAAAFETFTRSHPMHRAAPAFRARVIDTFKRGGFPSRVLDARAEFVSAYGLDSAYWKDRKPGRRPEVMALLKTNLSDLARHYHARGQKSGEASHYQAAIGYYRSYIDWFPDDAKTPRMHFLLAELLFDRHRYAEATEAYEAAAYHYGEHDKAAEAGYSALLAYDKRAAELEGEALSQWQLRATESELRFADTFPQHPKAPEVLLRASKELYARHDNLRTLAAAENLLSRYPDLPPRTRLSAQRLRGHAAFDQGFYPVAESAYAAALALLPKQGLGNAQRKEKSELTDNLAASVYKQGEGYRKAGNLEKAAEEFLRVGEVAPSASIRATAQYDAAAALLALKHWQRAAAVLEDFRARFPDSPMQGEVTRRLAVAYLSSGRGVAAAAELERLGRSDLPAEKRREALQQSADLYQKGGDLDRAAAVLATLAEQFKHPVEPRVEAMHRLAELRGQQGDAAGRRRWLEAIVKAHDGAGAEATDRTRYLAAHAAMALARDSFQAYSAVKLVEPIKPHLERKKRLMQATLDGYEHAADYGVADVTTSATYHTAAVYYDFSRALLDSERPGNLSDMELEQYNLLLEDRAFPFEEKAIKIHEINTGRVTEGIYDEWVRKSFRQLAKLFPARYGKSERNGYVAQTLR